MKNDLRSLKQEIKTSYIIIIIIYNNKKMI